MEKFVIVAAGNMFFNGYNFNYAGVKALPTPNWSLDQMVSFDDIQTAEDTVKQLRKQYPGMRIRLASISTIALRD